MAQPKPLSMDPAAAGVAILGLLIAPLVGLGALMNHSRIILAAVVVVVELVLIFRPRWGVPLLVAGTFFDEIFINVGFALLTMGDLAMLAVLPAWLFRRVVSRDRMRLPFGWPLLVTYVTWAGLSFFLGTAPGPATGYAIRHAAYLLCMVATIDMAAEAKVLRQVIWTMAILSVAHAIIALAMPAPGRIEGLVGQPNILADRLGLGAIALVVLFRERVTSLRSVLLGLGLVIVLVGMIMTVSRGAFVAVGITFVWLIGRDFRLLLLAAASVGLVVTTAELVQTKRRARIIERRMGFEDRSVRNRWAVVQNSFIVMGTHPLFGVGLGQFRHLNKAVEVTAEKHRGPHNFYLGRAAEVGLPGLFLFLAFLLRQWRGLGWAAGRLRKRLAAPEPDDDPATLARHATLVTTFQAIMICTMVTSLGRGGMGLEVLTTMALFSAVSLLRLPGSEQQLGAAPPRVKAQEPLMGGLGRPLA